MIVDLVEAELRRLENKDVLSKPQALGTVCFFVSCNECCDEVIGKVKMILKLIDYNFDKHEWDNLYFWMSYLPEWFVRNCSPEMTAKQTEQWLKWWKDSTDEEKKEEEENRKWSLLNWIYWFGPEARNWFWWNAKPISEKSFILEIIVNDWPFPWGSLRWLLQCAGAISINQE